MEGSVILGNSGRLAFFALLALMSAPARADVLEIGDDGARWIAGGSTAAPADGSPSAAYPASGDGAIDPATGLPLSVHTDPASHAVHIPAAYQAKVHELSARFDLSPTLIEALVWQESRWRETARSPVGARGLAQLMPGTARYLGVDPDDPFANLEGGARYLREQLDRFDGDIEKALAAYNAGPGRVLAARGIPNIRETKHYVASIMGRLSNYSRKGQ